MDLAQHVIADGRVLLLRRYQRVDVDDDLSASSSKVVEEGPGGKESVNGEAVVADDGEKDEFDCSFWGKYQHFQCSIHATRSDLTVEEFDYCAVLGILDTSTNGLRDLVCDRREIFTFDGIEYLPIKMPEKKNDLKKLER